MCFYPDIVGTTTFQCFLNKHFTQGGGEHITNIDCNIKKTALWDQVTGSPYCGMDLARLVTEDISKGK